MEAPSLPSSVTQIVHDGTTYYLVGTAHVSQKSVDEVRAVIEAVKPDVVCVELDKVRYEALTKDSAFRDLDVFKVIREGRALYLLAHLALASYQRRIGASLGVKPGAELLAAVNAADAAAIPVELIDRDINITLKRTWKNLGLWTRIKLFWSVLSTDDDDDDDDEEEDDLDVVVEKMKQPEQLAEMLTELGRAVPQIKGPLIDERDRYMASKAVEVGAGKRAVVVVVGAAHAPGMKAQWGEPVDRAALEKIPPKSRTWQILKWVIPLAFLAGMIYFWQRADDLSFMDMMLRWIIPTSVGAGVLTLLAGGSLIATLAAIVVSPLAAIQPLIRTGMVVGIVEAWRKRPGVLDCEKLPEDIQTFRGFFKNRVTRILLIGAAAGIGRSIGFWVGFAHVVTS